MSKEKGKKPKQKTQEQTGTDFNKQFTEAYVEIKNNAWNFSVVILIVIMISLSIYFQYRFEKMQRTSVMTDDSDENYYEILGLDGNADLATIRKKYKELTKIWHPDKNPGCKSCHEKFLQITKAHEILSDEAKRGEFDSKGKGIFSSQPVMLNVKNYHHLVEESTDFWVILVFENTRGNQHNKYVAEVWDEVSSKYKNIVRFGVIDVLNNENLVHFLPFKFQYYPNIITYLHGEGSELFQNIETYSVKSKYFLN
jgi:preprotein translocase subunit Sec63